MYNLFVSADQESWGGNPFDIDSARCIKEYTDIEIVEKYKDLSEKTLREIKRFPCIFAYEKPCGKNPKFGFIRDVAKRCTKVKVDYEIIEIDNFLTDTQINDLSFSLDIGDWELNRTHWAIKNINLSEVLYSKGIKLPQGIIRDSKSVDITKHNFEVALSFPGDIRGYIEPIVAHLEKNIGPNSYFYDNNYKSQLARPSLDLLLEEIYRYRSKLIVVFICQNYQEKEWCGIEFRAIRDIILNKQGHRIMYVKMDEGKVDGVLNTDGYIDGVSIHRKK